MKKDGTISKLKFTLTRKKPKNWTGFFRRANKKMIKE